MAVESSNPGPQLRPAGPWRVYDLMLADIETGRFDRASGLDDERELPRVDELTKRYGVEPDDVVRARYLLAADDHLRLLDPRPKAQRWAVGPSRPEDPGYEIVTAIRRIREDKDRDDTDPLKLDVYRVSPSREALAKRYGVTEHSVREAGELEYPGLPYGSPEIELEAFDGFTRPGGVRQLQPAVVEHLKAVLTDRPPRAKLPPPRVLAGHLGLDDERPIKRAYDDLTAAGWLIRGGKVGTFNAPRGLVSERSAREYTRQELRKLLGEAFVDGKFPGGVLPRVSTLTHWWREDGFPFHAAQVTRTLRELEQEGSVHRQGSGNQTKWFIDTVPALAPPVKQRKAAAPANTVEHIADTIEVRIVTREYPPGYRLPTNTELAEEFDVTVHVGQEALHVLAYDGLVATVMARGSGGRNDLPGRYVTPLSSRGHTKELAAAPVLERITRELAAGSFAGEIPCDRDTIWPAAEWFAAKYGVPEDTVSTALMVCGRRGLGANLRRDPRYRVPPEAFDPGPHPPHWRGADWAAERIEAGLLEYPRKGLRLPTGMELAERLGISPATAYRATAKLRDRLGVRKGQEAGTFTLTGAPTAQKPPPLRQTRDIELVLDSPPHPRSHPDTFDDWASNPPTSWEGTPATWRVHLEGELNGAAKRALLLATAENGLTGEVLRDNADVALRGIRQAIADAKSAAGRAPHTRAQFRGEARQLWAILDGVAPYLEGEFSAETVRRWIGDGGIPYAFHTQTPMPPEQERQFLVGIYENVQSCFAGAVEFVDRPMDDTGPGATPRTAIAPLGGKIVALTRLRAKGTAK